MSYPTHLIKVKNRFYYKIKVPSDLYHLFPCKFIKKSLHTSELNAAKVLLRYCEFKTHNAFALLRTNTLEAEYMQKIVHSLLPAPRANREYVTEDSKKVFHSMRHLVTDTLKQAGVLESVIAELVGHTNEGSETMGRYGKRYRPMVLIEALIKLKY